MTGQHLKQSQRFRIYETLHSLNQGFEQVLTELARLQESRFFRRAHLRQFQIVVAETRAWANFELVGVIQGREQHDWTRFGRLRRQWEKRYLDANGGPNAAQRLPRMASKAAGKRRPNGSRKARHV